MKKDCQIGSGRPSVEEKIAELDGVEMLSSALQTKLIADERLTKISIYELNAKSKQGFNFKHKVDDDLWHRFETQQTVIVTESYTYLRGINTGQKILLKTDQGALVFEVIGISAEYSGDQGHLVMGRQNYLRYWPDLGYSGIGVYASAGADLKQLESRIGQLLTAQQSVKPNQDIYNASMELSEQTFTI